MFLTNKILKIRTSPRSIKEKLVSALSLILEGNSKNLLQSKCYRIKNEIQIVSFYRLDANPLLSISNLYDNSLDILAILSICFSVACLCTVYILDQLQRLYR